MSNDVVIHVKAEGNVDRDIDRMGHRAEATAKKSFLRTGGHAGAAFAAGFLKTVTLGMVGSGFAMASMKMAPQMAHFGGALGVTLAAGLAVKAASALNALLPAALGGVMLAGPVIYLMKGMMKAEEEAKKAATRVDSLRKRYAAAEDADVKKRILGELQVAEAQEKTYRQRAQNWVTLKDKANDFMKLISKPVEPHLFKSMKLVGDRLDEWGPKVKRAMSQLAPVLRPFTKGVLDGIENFFSTVGRWMPSIQSGMKAWGQNMPRIGRAFGDMITSFMEDADGTADAVDGITDSIVTLTEAVGSVGKGFKKFDSINDRFVDMMLSQKKTIQGWRISTLEALVTVAEAWGRISPQMRQVAKRLKETLATARNDFNNTANEINHRQIRPKLQADKREAEEKIRDINRQLTQTHNKRTISKLKAEKAQAEAAIRKIKGMLSQLDGQEAVTWIRTNRVTYYGTHGKPPTNPKGDRATGGYIGGQHAATGGMRGNRTWVGEQGPELVDLPTGSHVHSNSDSRRMAMAGAGAGGPSITVNVTSPSNAFEIAREIAWNLKTGGR